MRALALLLLITLAGCGPAVNPSVPDPSQMPAASVPQDRPHVKIVITVLTEEHVPVTRIASITVTATDRSGQILNIADPANGDEKPFLAVNVRGKPISFVLTYQPGTAVINITAVIAGTYRDVAHVRVYDNLGNEILSAGNVVDIVESREDGTMKLAFAIPVSAI